MSPSTLRLDRGARRLAFLGGADVRLQGPALFGLESRDGGVLYQGRVLARVAKPGTAFVVQTPCVLVVDLGTEFQVEVDDRGQTEIRVIEGAVEVQTQVRLPRFYWSFDGPPGSMRDLVGGATIRPGPGLHRVEGIIGAGALEFDDSGGAYAEVVGGLGDQVGKGGFAVTHGITLEALIVPRWSGRALDYDEIFRKEDGDCRILLSFQNDGYAYDVPDVAPGPCLSFGLHLEGQGYSELDMPLDGLDGRPTLGDLRDGRPHHIAAVYDSFTGRKALYIDGRLCFAHTFPAGSLILSGGPTPTLIGNHCRRNEAFDGIIDEVAFYDFALTAGEVAAHHARSLRGAHYFDASDRELRGSRWRTYDRVTEGHTIRLDQVALTQEPSVGGPREGRP